MKYLLDTNTCICYLNKRSTKIISQLEALLPSDTIVCSITRAELFFGAMKSKSVEVTLEKQRKFLEPYRTLPFDDAAALIYGKVRAELETKGTPIGPNDLLIAAIALANQLTLVSGNVREFSRVSGLRIEDWEADT
jgi:tRNA(fMet)-specific endonuclease VapC